MTTKQIMMAGLGFAAVWWWMSRKNSATGTTGASGNTGVLVDVIGRDGSAAVYTPEGALVGFTNTEFISPWTIGFGVKK